MKSSFSKTGAGWGVSLTQKSIGARYELRSPKWWPLGFEMKIRMAYIRSEMEETMRDEP